MPASRRPPHFAKPGEPIFCPNGHEIKRNAWAVSEDPMMVQRCNHKWEPGNRGICGLCVWWLMDKGGGRIVVEVTSLDAHKMETERMSLGKTLEFLNLRWVTEGPPYVAINPPGPTYRPTEASR